MAKSTIKLDNNMHTKTIESESMTIAAGARNGIELSTGLPNNTRILSVLLVWSPHVEWIRTSVALGDADENQKIFVRYHNENNSAVTGKWTFAIRYCYT